jgi:hypothetical protein
MIGVDSTPKRIRGKVKKIDDNLRYPTPLHWQGANLSRGSSFQRSSNQRDGYTTPPQGRVQKRYLESKLHHGTASVSQLLYEDRPLLKPVTFVRSGHTPTLFLEEEEIFKPVVEEAGRRIPRPTTYCCLSVDSFFRPQVNKKPAMSQLPDAFIESSTEVI